MVIFNHGQKAELKNQVEKENATIWLAQTHLNYLS